jgi:cation transporter-like permease
MKRYLFKGEEEVQSWGGITLTTHRVIYFSDADEASTSLLLSQIEWTRIARKHTPLFVLLAILVVIAGVVLGQGNAVVTLGAILAAIVFLLAYFVGRVVSLEIGAGQGRIDVVIKGGTATRASARDLLDQVDIAALAIQQTIKLPADAGRLRSA